MESAFFEALLKRECEDTSESEIKQPVKRRCRQSLAMARVYVPDSQMPNTPPSGKLKDRQYVTPHIKVEKENTEPKRHSGNIYRLGKMCFETEDREDGINLLGLALKSNLKYM